MTRLTALDNAILDLLCSRLAQFGTPAPNARETWALEAMATAAGARTDRELWEAFGGTGAVDDKRFSQELATVLIVLDALIADPSLCEGGDIYEYTGRTQVLDPSLTDTGVPVVRRRVVKKKTKKTRAKKPQAEPEDAAGPFWWPWLIPAVLGGVLATQPEVR